MVIRTDESEVCLERGIEEERGLERLGETILRGGGFIGKTEHKIRVISQVLLAFTPKCHSRQVRLSPPTH